MAVHPEAYRAADRGVVRVDRSDRLRWAIEGPDRVTFLQNLLTNDVQALEPGRACEAFVTSPQGKTLAFVTIHAAEDHILLRSEAAARVELEPHFTKYGVFDDVRWRDLTPTTFEIHLAGPRTGSLLDRLQVSGQPATDREHRTVQLGGRSARLLHESPTGRPGVTILGDLGDRDAILEALQERGQDLGLVACDAETFDVLRIEAGTPLFGTDITSANLPQEVDRDRWAISFHKGCYLGQETVARIDALGHVNKLLRGLRFEPGEVPPPGTPLTSEGKAVGTITSSAFSPGLGVPIGLGYVRRTLSSPAQALGWMHAETERKATVVSLPFLARDGSGESPIAGPPGGSKPHGG